MHCAHLDEAREMVGNALQETSPGIRFAAPPWNDQSAPWRQIDAQLPQDHLAREIREAMIHLDLTALYASYAGRGKVPHRPDLMLAIVLFELRRGQRQPSQWFHDTHENCALWWLGYGIRPARSCWYEFRERTAALVDTMNTHVLHQAVEAELTTGERGALDGSAVAANASRRRLLNAERLQQRVYQLHSPSERRAPDKLVVSTGDPEAALGMDKDHVFRPLYTIQTVRDVDSPLILSYDVFAQATDAGTFSPMLARTKQLTGRRLKEVLVDSGYVTGIDLALCAQAEITLYGPWKANDVPSWIPIGVQQAICSIGLDGKRMGGVEVVRKSFCATLSRPSRARRAR